MLNNYLCDYLNIHKLLVLFLGDYPVSYKENRRYNNKDNSHIFLYLLYRNYPL